MKKSTTTPRFVVVGDGQLADTKTGKIYRGTEALIVERTPRPRRRQPHPFGGDWLWAHQIAARWISTNKRLTEVHHRILWWLISEARDENFVAVSNKAAADQLGIRPENIRHALRVMVAELVLEEGPRSGFSRTYRLNPWLVWRGPLQILADNLRPADAARTTPPLRIVPKNQEK